MPTETEVQPKYRFRLLAGWHYTDDGKEHGPGTVFDDVHPLDEMFNTPSGKKFERLDSKGEVRNVVQAPIRDKLDAKTVAELREFASEEEIDLGTATTKKDIIAKIRATPGAFANVPE